MAQAALGHFFPVPHPPETFSTECKQRRGRHMCLIVFAWKATPEYRLVLAANRDEFHERAARQLHWWPDSPGILAGRDMQAGGTWLAAGRSGRLATVTNYREQQVSREGLRSRGELVSNFVRSADSAMDFSAAIVGERYAGFSLLTTDGEELCHVSNRGDAATRLAPGIYGLSNASLDTPWPKLVRTREALRRLISTDRVDESELLRLMSDRTLAADTETQHADLPFELARALTAPFILGPDYGTRCTTIVLWDYNDRILLAETRFDSTGSPSGDARFSFIVAAP
jgi:uncharacterized protein with NRDE domain